MRLIPLLALLVLTAYSNDAAIHHRFMAVDESRSQLHLVDQRNPVKNWTVKLHQRSRDIQRLDDNSVLVTNSRGYNVYAIDTGKLLRKFRSNQLRGMNTGRMRADGRFVGGCNRNGLTFVELDKDGTLLRQVEFSQLKTVRLMRLSSRDTLLFGANNEVIEASWAGKILRRHKLDKVRHIYEVRELEDGKLLVATGYGKSLVVLDSAGKIVKRYDDQPDRVFYKFFAGMQLLPNGHIVVCNWTGHGADDSRKGPQLLEFDVEGKLVWRWHDPERAGTLHGVLILDSFDRH